MDNLTEFRAGMKNGLPICLGYFAVSFAFGIQAAQIGLSPWQAGLISVTNVTSAGQFAGLSLIASQGSLAEMALLQLVINLRYLLMSAALSQKLSPSVRTLPRLIMAYGVTDEIFGVSVTRPGNLNPWFSYGCILISVLGWTGGTAAGASAGAVLPEILIAALGIALYGMFIAIIIPPAREQKAAAICVIASMAASALFFALPYLKGISSGMKIIIVTIGAAAFCAKLFPLEEEEP
ncbi:MAG: AzlC family ABC transporter permease [Lachnospiraceae bacterium]|nr:AzlC family ABC transporter permease [Lachnospiraceae bacterium]